VIRGRVPGALISIAVAAAIAGCGGGDDPEVATPGPEAAEQTARDFLLAGVEGDDEKACGILSPQFEQDLQETFPCETMVDVQADLAEKGDAAFDSQPMDPSNVDELQLQTTVSEDGQAASVTGPKGDQTIGMQVLNGEWVVSSLPTAEQFQPPDAG
jgi:hypothetical protein